VGIGGNSCGYSVATMYNNLCGFHDVEENSIWKKIWRLGIPERARAFIWMLVHNRLLTNSRKSKMGLCHAMCVHCGNKEETALHVMRDCPIAKEVWTGAITLQDRGLFFIGDFKHWISVNLNNMIHWSGRGAWCELWSMSCYYLWTWRNRESHDEDFVRPYRQFHHINNMLSDYRNAAKASDVASDSNQSLVLVRWIPPKPLFVRLNTDGAYKEHKIAGCGGVLRGADGEWLGGYAKCVGLCSAFVAELWGVVEGLRYAHRLGFRKIQLSVDSAAVVQVLANGTSKSMMGTSLVKQIKMMLEQEWSVEISHSYREANKCADALATLGCSLSYDIVVFDSCPEFLRELYLADIQGSAAPRLVAV
jgi:ribonuclease HI